MVNAGINVEIMDVIHKVFSKWGNQFSSNMELLWRMS